MNLEKHIRESGQHPGHKCPVCGNPLEKEVIVTEELVIVDGVAVALPPRLMKLFRRIYDNLGRPVNRAVLGSSPKTVKAYLSELRRHLLHTRLAVHGTQEISLKMVGERKSN